MQFGQLMEQAPDLLGTLEERFGIENLERRLAEQIRGFVERASLLSNLAGISSAVLGALANLILVVAAGVYLAADPRTYRLGLLRVFPAQTRADAEETVDALGSALRLWLLGVLARRAEPVTADSGGHWPPLPHEGPPPSLLQ